MLARLRRVGTEFATLAGLRLELLGVELREQGDHLLRVCLLGIAMILLAFLALGFLAALVVAALWDTHRLAALGIFGAGFLAAALWCARRLSIVLAAAPPPFQATIDEFRKDAAALTPRSARDGDAAA